MSYIWKLNLVAPIKNIMHTKILNQWFPDHVKIQTSVDSFSNQQNNNLDEIN